MTAAVPPASHGAAFQLDDLVRRIHGEQPSVAKRDVEIDIMLHRRKAMVGHDANGRAAWRHPFCGRPQRAHHGVETFQHRARRRAEGARMMLLGVETGQVDGDEIRPLGLEETLRIARPHLILRHRLFHSTRITIQASGQLLLQPRRAQRALQFAIILRAGTPDLRQVISDGSADADGPIHIGRAKPRCGGGVPQRGDSAVLRVPIPASIIAVERIKGRIRVDPVLGRAIPRS